MAPLNFMKIKKGDFIMVLNENQLILLDNIIYLDSTAKVEEGTSVGRLVNGLLDLSDEDFKKEVTDEQFYYCGNMVNGMSVEEWRNVLTAIKNDEYLMNMQITNNSKAEWFFHSALILFKHLCYVL